MPRSQVLDRPMAAACRIDAYIENAAPFAQPILEHLRDTLHAAVPGVEEAVKWSMPFFVYKGIILANTAGVQSALQLPHLDEGPGTGDAVQRRQWRHRRGGARQTDRDRRVQQAVTMIAEGKGRHARYETGRAGLVA